MPDDELFRVKSDLPVGKGLGRSVFHVAQDRVADERQLGPYLVKPAGAESHAQEASIGRGFNNGIRQLGFFRAASRARKHCRL